MDNIWQILTIIITSIFSAGGGILLAPKIWKKKELASAKSAEHQADQERERAEELELSNTDKLVQMYKGALSDIQELHNKEKQLLMDTIKRQDAKLSEMSEKLDRSFSEIDNNSKKTSELLKENSLIKKELDELKRMITTTCDDCEFKEPCERRKYISSRASGFSNRKNM